MNRVMLIGDVIGCTGMYEGGTVPVFKFSLATSEPTQKGSIIKEFHNVVAFGAIANGCLGIKVSDKVSVDGKIKSQQYTDKTGVQKRITQIIANAVDLLCVGGGQAQASAPAPAPANNTPPPPPPPVLGEGEVLDDDDIPF